MPSPSSVNFLVASVAAASASATALVKLEMASSFASLAASVKSFSACTAIVFAIPLAVLATDTAPLTALLQKFRAELVVLQFSPSLLQSDFQEIQSGIDWQPLRRRPV